MFPAIHNMSAYYLTLSSDSDTFASSSASTVAATSATCGDASKHSDLAWRQASHASSLVSAYTSYRRLTNSSVSKTNVRLLIGDDIVDRGSESAERHASSDAEQVCGVC